MDIERNQTFSFKMQHAFDFIWERAVFITEKYIGICEELLKKENIIY